LAKILYRYSHVTQSKKFLDASLSASHLSKVLDELVVCQQLNAGQGILEGPFSDASPCCLLMILNPPGKTSSSISSQAKLL